MPDTVIVRKTLLAILADCQGYLLPEPTLHSHALLLLPNLTRTEFDIELRWLDANGYVAGITPELGGPRKWKITEKGKLEL